MFRGLYPRAFHKMLKVGEMVFPLKHLLLSTLLASAEGTTRVAAAFMICMAAIALCIDLASVNPRLVSQLQSIHINLHVATDPGKLFMKSMTVSHDNVRQKPHVFYWIRSVPKQ